MKRAIVTAAFGAYERIAALTIPGFKTYAKKVGADFVLIGGEEFRNILPGPHWAKTVAGKLLTLGDCDEILWIDSDAAINPRAGNIFEAADGKFAAYPESHRADRINGFRKYLRIVVGGKIATVTISAYFNSGVMVVPRKYSGILDMPPERELAETMRLRREHPEKFFHDQDWINSRILTTGAEVVELPLGFNHMPFDDVWDQRHAASIIHYAGLYSRLGNGLLERVRSDLRKWDE